VIQAIHFYSGYRTAMGFCW